MGRCEWSELLPLPRAKLPWEGVWLRDECEELDAEGEDR
jgi:hypothetical protein